MNLYMTSGTQYFMEKMVKDHPNEKVLLMQNNETTLLVHETEGKTFFKTPRKFEIMQSLGTLIEHGFVSMRHIPVTEEDQPVFELRLKNYSKLIENQPGLLALRVLRPIKSDTYIILTQWKSEKESSAWQTSALDLDMKVNSPKNLFSGNTYVSNYFIPVEE